MLVSVILNCLNGEKFLRRSIESVLNQTFDIFEIVFIDNGSSDLSGEIAREFGSIISYYRNETTTTLGKARDQGIMLAKGDLIAFIDADDKWRPDKVEKQIRLFENGASFVFSNAEMSEGQGKSFILFDYAPPEIDNIFNSLLEKDFITTSSVMFIKDIYINSNEKYNNHLTIECDRDLFIRFTGECKFEYTEDVLVTRYLHNSSTSVRHNAASIKELIYLEESINSFISNRTEYYQYSLDVFNSRLNILKGRHYWQRGDLKNARASFLKSGEKKGFLMFILTYIYPFKSSLKPIILILRYLKFFIKLIEK
jgi:glycosyltransferase involved in cell wall biosynthesis